MVSAGLRTRFLFLLAVLFEASLAGLGWLLGWIVHSLPGARFSWSLSDAAIGVAASLPMLLIFLVCLRWPIGPLRGIHDFLDEVLRPLLGACSVLEIAVLSLVAGIGEEVLFRGAVQGALSDWLGPAWALVLASVLFGLMHPITLTYFVLAALAGGYLGWLWQATDNLLVPIVTHAVYDFGALVVLLRRPRRSG